MRLSEIEEARGAILRTGTTDPVSWRATKRFLKEYRTFAKAFPSIRESFAEFVEAKDRNPDAPFKKKDSQWGSGQIDGISGWWHAHLFFGKAVIIYKPVGRVIYLAALVDHLSVEGVGQRIRALGEYLKGIKLAEIPAVDPSELTDVDKKDQEAQIAANVDRVIELFYAMAANKVDRELLDAFVSGKSDDALEFLAFVDLPHPDSMPPREQLMIIAREALRHIP